MRATFLSDDSEDSDDESQDGAPDAKTDDESQDGAPDAKNTQHIARPPEVIPPSRRNSASGTCSRLSDLRSVADMALAKAHKQNGRLDWSAAGWVASLPEMTDTIAQALLSGFESGTELDYVINLGSLGAEGVRAILDEGRLLEGLSKQLALAAKTFAKQRAATATDLHAKFCQDESLQRLKFGELKNFYSGLDGVVGPPATDLEMGMLREHTKCRDSQVMFEAPNYGTQTTSEIEYYFVTEPMCDQQSRFEVHPMGANSVVEEFEVLQDGELCWPREKKLEGRGNDPLAASILRKPMPPEHFARELQMRNDQLAKLGLPLLQSLEFICGRLYVRVLPPLPPPGTHITPAQL